MYPRTLELLAPARNLEIGIAAIDCGADAVYLAAEDFGARSAAGNSIEDIATLCRYARRFGCRIFVTVNTLIYEEELPRVETLVRALEEAGVDALIVQDPAVVGMSRIPVHASTQCAIRTAERARFLESLGFSRQVLERQLSLEEIRQIRAAIQGEIECFVHGALCVCYSGQCYLSEQIEGRSANRGRCIQACRSLYDLVDDQGHVLLKNKPILSLKDLNLIARLEDLADAGVSSFKIEGRLKNISYVRNVVRAYSLALDRLIASRPEDFRRASFGRAERGFTPDLDKTFNRSYTTLFLDGKRGTWASGSAAKGMGELLGTIEQIRPEGKDMVCIQLSPVSPRLSLRNGDGFACVTAEGKIIGFRGDRCEGRLIHAKRTAGLSSGLRLYRNIDTAFEKQMLARLPERLLQVVVDAELSPEALTLRAIREDGSQIESRFPLEGERADNPARVLDMIRSQLSKKSGYHRFTLRNLFSESEICPLISSARLNEMRRSLAARLEETPLQSLPLRTERLISEVPGPAEVSYRENVANSRTEALYRSRGARQIAPAYECQPVPGAELMRSKYCIRHQLGLCLKERKDSRKLYLLNNRRRFALGFDCARCEMTLRQA